MPRPAALFFICFFFASLSPIACRTSSSSRDTGSNDASAAASTSADDACDTFTTAQIAHAAKIDATPEREPPREYQAPMCKYVEKIDATFPPRVTFAIFSHQDPSKITKYFDDHIATQRKIMKLEFMPVPKLGTRAEIAMMTGNRGATLWVMKGDAFVHLEAEGFDGKGADLRAALLELAQIEVARLP